MGPQPRDDSGNCWFLAMRSGWTRKLTTAHWRTGAPVTARLGACAQSGLQTAH